MESILFSDNPLNVRRSIGSPRNLQSGSCHLKSSMMGRIFSRFLPMLTDLVVITALSVVSFLLFSSLAFRFRNSSSYSSWTFCTSDGNGLVPSNRSRSDSLCSVPQGHSAKRSEFLRRSIIFWVLKQTNVKVENHSHMYMHVEIRRIKIFSNDESSKYGFK